jgi:D-alanine-D-alanine ligase-like ATP-grasp enzyme/GNAT superfamily N-acetyltransferase
VRRCTILHQHVPPDAPPDEQDVLAAAESVARGLRNAGWAVAVCPMGLDIAAAGAALADTAPDIVFNLVESLGGADVMALAAAALLEDLGLRYTGSGLAALALTADKRATRRALRAAGIPVPPGPDDGWAGPFIVKHATCHASFGLGAHSVVADLPEVPAGWYAEAFIDGREFNIALLGDGAGGVTILPVAELLFRDWPAGMPRILDYAGKWDATHPLYQRSVRGFDVAPELASFLGGLAKRCWQALGLAGYARIDLRLDGDGVAYVIDVNANPCLSEDAGFAAAAAQAGLAYLDVLARIVEAANTLPLRPRLRGERVGVRWVYPTLVTVERPSSPCPLLPEGGRRGNAGAGDTTSICLRPDLRPDDDIAALCAATGFFTAAEIAVADELAADRRARGPASDYYFLLADTAETLAGYACYGPIAGTAEAWDLYWIVVHPDAQGRGIGRSLVAAVLDDMLRLGGRRLYAETAGKPLYAPTRAFYAAAGFTLQAVVPDFYAPGDGKQIWLLTGRSIR